MSTADIDRRRVLRAGFALTGAGLLAGCGSKAGSPSRLVTAGSARVRAVEAGRTTTGRVQEVTLTAQAGPVDLGGVQVDTWTYGGALPGQPIRVTKGDIIQARLVNRLPAATTIHWHGLALRNDMDGVPDVTQAAVAPGAEFTYRFVADTPGTYWLHPHAGVQLDRGLYAPLIVDDPADPGGYDQDWTVVLDDWLDGTGTDPDQVLATLRKGMGGMNGMTGMGGMNGGMLMGAASRLLGGDAGDVAYPYYLINGRVPAAPATFTARPGQRVRLRFLNAASDTAFRVALSGHRLRVTHTDGHPVNQTEVDGLLIGMGERYDVEVTLGDGAFGLVALAEGKNATAWAVVRTGAGAPPPATLRPAELDGLLARYDRLHPTPQAALPAGKPQVTHRVDLTGTMMRYDWGINGHPFDPDRRLHVREGQRVRLTLRNRTMMFHPMHLHGHTFAVGGTGLRKDTVIVLPGQTIHCDLHADNPGQWALHCHNIYHAETGMMTLLGYRK